MAYIKVRSSFIDSAKLVEDRLYVRFRTGAIYRYEGVTKNKFSRLLKTGTSSYYSRMIRGKYESKRVQ
jgi:hypothetical protein